MTMANAAKPDAVVIGSGSGGLTVAVGLGRLGRAAVLVEADQMGGDCTNVGCIPSKALLHLSHSHDGRSALARVRQRRDELRAREEVDFGGAAGVDFRRGRGRIVGPGQVEITNPDGSTDRVEAENVVLATGSRPIRLDIDGLPVERYHTNESIFELDEPPRRLVIVGGGAVGVEMATAFNRLGSAVTVVEAAPRVLSGMLPDVGHTVRRLLEARGVEVIVGSQAASYDRASGSLLLENTVDEAQAGSVASCDSVLVAVGRRPNSGDLGLGAVGAATDEKGFVVIDDRGRTGVDGLWACGDVTPLGGSTHAASALGRRILRSIVAGRFPLPDLPPIPSVVFADPEAASIGEQPDSVGPDVSRIIVPLSSVDRAYTDEADDGFLILDVRRFTGKVLGATIVGPRAGELISIVSFAMKSGIPLHKWVGTVWPYPTYADLLSHAVDTYMTETMQSVGGEFVQFARGLWRRRRGKS